MAGDRMNRVQECIQVISSLYGCEDRCVKKDSIRLRLKRKWEVLVAERF